jgi:hypothetical protein
MYSSSFRKGEHSSHGGVIAAATTLEEYSDKFFPRKDSLVTLGPGRNREESSLGEEGPRILDPVLSVC